MVIFDRDGTEWLFEVISFYIVPEISLYFYSKQSESLKVTLSFNSMDKIRGIGVEINSDFSEKTIDKISFGGNLKLGS